MPKAVNLQKTQAVSLAKSLKNVLVGMNWQAPESKNGFAFDLDVSVFALADNGKIIALPENNNPSFIFYGQQKFPNESIIHTGDERSGNTENEYDEAVQIQLNNLYPAITKLAITVTIDNAFQRGQNLKDVDSASITVINSDTNEKIAVFDLQQMNGTAILFAEFIKQDNNWVFKAVGESYDGLPDLAAFCKMYGVNVE